MKKYLHHIGYLISIALFVLAVVVIHYKLKQYHYRDIVSQILQTPFLSLVSALILTFLNYFVLSWLDILALRYVKAHLKYPKIAIASFIGYAFSMNTTVVGGSAARYRIYTSFGVSAANVAKLVIFYAITFWLGFFAIGAFCFIFSPLQIPDVIKLPFISVRPIGFVFLVLVIGYLVLILLIKKPLNVRGWEFQPPGFTLSIGQILVSSLDWILAAWVLYVLIPHDGNLTYEKFLGIFLLAQVGGLVSHIPGGLGIFETIILLLLTDFGESAALVGSLLLYRIIYYILPLIFASVLLGINEYLNQRHIINQVGKVLGQFGKIVIPNVLAFTTFIAGVILLFSGSLPAEKGRIAVLRDFLPLPAIEISHFLGSVVGAVLIVLARGLQRRINAAVHITMVLLVVGIAFSILKGLDYEEAVVLAVMLLVIFPYRKEFYRKASLFSQKFSPGWIISIVVVVACSVWLGMFSYRHIVYSHSLWWRFAFEADAPRFLRATTAAIIIFLLYFVFRLHLPGKHVPVIKEDVTELEKAEKIVRGSPKTYSWLALLGDKRFLLDEVGSAFIMYAVQGRSWVALGEPVGPRDKWRELVWDFLELCDQNNGWPVFYQVEKEHLDLYLDLGLNFVKLGEEARVNLAEFSISGAAHSGLRHSRNKILKLGCDFSIIPSQDVPDIMQQLRGVSDEWLKEKKTREKRFSLGYFNPQYIARTPVAVIRQEKRILAFANVLIGADKEEISVDLMRFAHDDPDGVMDYLFVEIMLWAKEQGYRWFNFGMAPLSGIEDRALAPLWSHAGAFIFRYGEYFYNFQGLRQYKEKFGPQWRPKYMACPKGLMLPNILANIAALISEDIRGIITK
jgi:phosphatidylglycerol lysyltransferase